MSNDYWKYWELVTSNGKQYWQFSAPDFLKNETGTVDWNSEKSVLFLNKMSESFIYNKQDNPNAADLVFRSQKTAFDLQPIKKNPFTEFGNVKENNIAASLYKGIHFYSSLQTKDGNWTGDYGGPLFLLPGIIIASYITHTPFDTPTSVLIQRYMLNMQNADGGWGLHIEGKSTMFGTVMQYVSLRISGVDRNNAALIKAKNWIQQHGGAIGIPSWGKFYLSLLNIYDWSGNNSILPELWLMPKSLSFHPSNYWCHTRMVYLPMTYCYGHKITMPFNELTQSLREDIYTQDYDAINWKKCRDDCNEIDLYAKPSRLQKYINPFLNFYEKNNSDSLRKKALDFILDYINAEDEHTGYINIGPVSKAINSIAIFHAYGKDSIQFKKHIETRKDYLWLAEDGIKMNGYNGSQLWDTAFATQAIIESGMSKHFSATMERSYHYLDYTQIKNEPRQHEKYFRHASVGGWPFSTLQHGWPITDCTAEGISATIAIHRQKLNNIIPKINNDRIKKACDLILSFQNKDGGWASYELTRGNPTLEKFNPAAVFENIMIDYSYVECTSACIRALTEVLHSIPDYKKDKIENAVKNGISFILKNQREDGSWLGSWAVCFTYGTWFGVEALVAAGYKKLNENNPSVYLQKACNFLVQHQNEDGGWGESFDSCVQKKYIAAKQSQVVNTSWALLSLMAAEYPDKKVIEKGIQFLIQRQQENGDWKQENISGVFNFNCMITYTAYRNVFPIWAIGRFHKKYKSETNAI